MDLKYTIMGKGDLIMMNHLAKQYCYQKYDNPLVQEIRLLYYYEKNDSKGDCCEVIFCDGTSVIHKLNNESGYTRQYGVPLSDDGTIMYICDWYKGLTAYDTRSGKELWRINKPHIRMTQLFQDFGVTLQSAEALIQFDLQTGTVLTEIGGKECIEMDRMFFLKDELVLIYRYHESACIVDCRTMTIAKRIDPRILDPYKCLSFVLLNTYVKDNQVIAVGWESGARTEIKFRPKHNFERVIHVFDSTVLK